MTALVVGPVKDHCTVTSKVNKALYFITAVNFNMEIPDLLHASKKQLWLFADVTGPLTLYRAKQMGDVTVGSHQQRTCTSWSFCQILIKGLPGNFSS